MSGKIETVGLGQEQYVKNEVGQGERATLTHSYNILNLNILYMVYNFTRLDHIIYGSCSGDVPFTTLIPPVTPGHGQEYRCNNIGGNVSTHIRSLHFSYQVGLK